MSLARGKFGIEYDPQRIEEKSSNRGLVIFAVVLVVLVSFTVTLVNRLRARVDEAADPANAPQEARAPQSAAAPLAAPPLPPAVPPEKAALTSRPRVMRNLLMRLTEAERDRDLSRQIETIESLRALPGNPAADIDHLLVKRLGRLNLRWLFGGETSPWVTKVTPRKGTSAARLAKEQGITLALLLRLNFWRTEDKMRVGEPVRVLNQPNFTLIIHRRSCLAELMLNGKLFKAYDLKSAPTASSGYYQATEDAAAQLQRLGIVFAPADLAEVKLFLLESAPLLVAEY